MNRWTEPGTTRRVRLLKEVQPMREDEKRCLLVHGLDGNYALLTAEHFQALQLPFPD